MSKAGRTTPPKDFESAMVELETLVANMEAGGLSLEHALGAYRRGTELLAFCQNALSDADQQVKILENGVLKDLPVELQADRPIPDDDDDN